MRDRDRNGDALRALRLGETPPSPKTIPPGGREGFLPARLIGRKAFWSTGPLVDRKGFFPVDKDVPC
jgi:hypothetical protein